LPRRKSTSLKGNKSMAKAAPQSRQSRQRSRKSSRGQSKKQQRNDRESSRAITAKIRTIGAGSDRSSQSRVPARNSGRAKTLYFEANAHALVAKIGPIRPHRSLVPYLHRLTFVRPPYYSLPGAQSATEHVPSGGGPCGSARLRPRSHTNSQKWRARPEDGESLPGYREGKRRRLLPVRRGQPTYCANS